MPDVHPSAILEGDVQLAPDVAIGPHCVVTGPVTIGSGTRLLGSVYLQGPLTIGTGNTLYPQVCLGFAPQSVRYDARVPGHGLTIGDGNTFREGATVHRAMTAEGPTTIGSRNWFMGNSHAGHDARVGDDCVFANGALVGGHVRIDDGVNVGGNGSVHQFVRVGRGVMISGLSGAALDVPPYMIVTSINVCASVNLVGLRRAGRSREEIDDVRWVYRTLFRRGLSKPSALEVLRERGDRPLVAEFIDFIEASERGICTARVVARRTGTAAAT